MVAIGDRTIGVPGWPSTSIVRSLPRAHATECASRPLTVLALRS
jgi:hypothetical protein